MSIFKQHVAEIPSIKKKQFLQSEANLDDMSMQDLKDEAVRLGLSNDQVGRFGNRSYKKTYRAAIRAEMRARNSSSTTTRPKKKAAPRKKATRRKVENPDISEDLRRNDAEMERIEAINAEKRRQLAVLDENKRLEQQKKKAEYDAKIAAMQEGAKKKYYIDMGKKLISEYTRLISTIGNLGQNGDEDEWLNQIERVPDSEQGYLTTTKVYEKSPVAKMLSALSETVKTIISNPNTPENIKNAIEGRSGSGWSSRIASWWKGGRILFPSPGSTCVGAGRGDWFCGLTRQLNRQHVVRFVSDCENLIREWDPSSVVPTLNKTYAMIDERDSLMADKELLRTKWATRKLTGAVEMKKLRNKLESVRMERDESVRESDGMEKRIVDLRKQIEEQQQLIVAAEARAKEAEEEKTILNDTVSTLENENERLQVTIDTMEGELSNQGDELEAIHKKLNVKKYVRMKSSLKFCVIAAGEYDGYVAEPRACEWDIAAGHAILKHAGGDITDFDGNEILYGKKDFKNPSLVVKSQRLLLNE